MANAYRVPHPLDIIVYKKLRIKTLCYELVKAFMDL